jgi:hypothetical protein
MARRPSVDSVRSAAARVWPGTSYASHVVAMRKATPITHDAHSSLNLIGADLNSMKSSMTHLTLREARTMTNVHITKPDW